MRGVGLGQCGVDIRQRVKPSKTEPYVCIGSTANLLKQVLLRQMLSKQIQARNGRKGDLQALRSTTFNPPRPHQPAKSSRSPMSPRKPVALRRFSLCGLCPFGVTGRSDRSHNFQNMRHRPKAFVPHVGPNYPVGYVRVVGHQPDFLCFEANPAVDYPSRLAVKHIDGSVD